MGERRVLGDHESGQTDLDPHDVEEIEEALAEIEPESIPHAIPKPKWTTVALRFFGSLALLGLLFWRLPELDFDELVPDITASTIGWILLAIGVHVVAYVLQTLRWAEVSDTLGIHLPFKRMFAHLLAGEFVSNALPTSVGGDVVRVVRQGREAGDYADAFASTSLERLTGWLVLPLISMVAMIFQPELFHLGGATTTAIIINAVTLVALLSLLYLAGHPRGAGRLVGRTGWRRYLGAVHLGIVAFRHRPGRVTRVIVAGIGFQFLQCMSVWASARALEIPEVTIFAAMAFWPPTAVAQNLPIALGGLGIREAMFVLFFGALGATDSQCVGLGLLVYLVFIAASLAGAPSFAVGSRRRHADLNTETAGGTDGSSDPAVT